MLSIVKLLLLLDVRKVFAEGTNVIVCLVDESVLIEATCASICVINRSFFSVSLAFESLTILILM